MKGHTSGCEAIFIFGFKALVLLLTTMMNLTNLFCSLLRAKSALQRAFLLNIFFIRYFLEDSTDDERTKTKQTKVDDDVATYLRAGVMWVDHFPGRRQMVSST